MSRIGRHVGAAALAACLIVGAGCSSTKSTKSTDTTGSSTSVTMASDTSTMPLTGNTFCEKAKSAKVAKITPSDSRFLATVETLQASAPSAIRADLDTLVKDLKAMKDPAKAATVDKTELQKVSGRITSYLKTTCNVDMGS